MRFWVKLLIDKIRFKMVDKCMNKGKEKGQLNGIINAVEAIVYGNYLTVIKCIQPYMTNCRNTEPHLKENRMDSRPFLQVLIT